MSIPAAVGLIAALLIAGALLLWTVNASHFSGGGTVSTSQDSERADG